MNYFLSDIPNTTKEWQQGKIIHYFDKGNLSFNNGLFIEAEEYFNLSLKYLSDRVSTLSSLLICKIKFIRKEIV